MNQTAAIIKNVTSLWLASPALSSLVAGGLLYGTLKAKSRPYGQLKVSLHGNPAFHSGPSCLQTYMVELSVWGGPGLESVGDIQDALLKLFPHNAKFALDGNAAVLAILPYPAGIEEEAHRSATGGIGQNVFIAGAMWRIQIVEDKQPA